ncbi:MAG: Uma2 family endonuclease [Pirellulales bacterium]
MSTLATSHDSTESTTKALTAADLAALPSDLPSGPVLYELENGRLIIMSPPGYIHGRVEIAIASAFYEQGDRRGLGETVGGETGVILWRDPDRVVGVDVAFVAKASLPIKLSPEGYLETIPDLVVEVRSKNDSPGYVRRKVDDYLAAGVRIVWTVDPAARSLIEYRRDTAGRTFTEADTVTVEDVLPGFRLVLATLFSLPT